MSGKLIHLTSEIQRDRELIDSFDANLDYVIYLPTKSTKLQEKESLYALLDEKQISPDRRIEINISSIVQKAWRIIKHYTQGEAALEKGEARRKTHNGQLTQKNRQRLLEIESRVRNMVLYDQRQALNLQAPENV